MRLRFAAAAMMALTFAGTAHADGFLQVSGTQIVDATNKPVILRGMGLGGWMLQEGYMLKLGELGQQHVIRAKLVELVGEKRTAAFYKAWLDNQTTKADMDAMGRWGFNSVRLPIHFDQLTLPADKEPVSGKDTWHKEGFARIDRLLAWSKANHIYLILDLHATPGGQGNDLAISDRDPSKPSLWESPENQRKTIAIWTKLAKRYKNEPWIGGYDMINEPNWSFATPGKGNGCDETENKQVWDLQQRITSAIRAVDKKHIIFIEGNCWGNNYKGLPPAWDPNLVVSFHKYWNYNNQSSIADIVRLRSSFNRPIWLGESGENSNVWFRDAIKLVEDNCIGWAFWPLKKMGFNQPLEIKVNPGWQEIVDWATGKGPKPDADKAYAAMMQLATKDVRFENLVQHPDVIDAMFRQPRDAQTIPFVQHRLNNASLTVLAADYDMGAANAAYKDQVDANYHIATGKDRVLWNNGSVYRNDGVDIMLDADGQPVVTDFVTGEWMRYTIEAASTGNWSITLRIRAKSGARIGIGDQIVRAPASDEWQDVIVPHFPVTVGARSLKIQALQCTSCEIRSLTFTPL